MRCEILRNILHVSEILRNILLLKYTLLPPFQQQLLQTDIHMNRFKMKAGCHYENHMAAVYLHGTDLHHFHFEPIKPYTRTK